MRCLIDTHIALWALMDTRKLQERAREILEDPAHEVFVSTVSIWEISLKYSLGKLDLRGVSPEMLPSLFQQMGFSMLPLDTQDAASFCRFPKSEFHRDPFDRMLAWQSICRGMSLLSQDTALGEYAQHGLALA